MVQQQLDSSEEVGEEDSYVEWLVAASDCESEL